MSVYTVRQCRAKLKEVIDLLKDGKCVHIKQKSGYLRVTGVHVEETEDMVIPEESVSKFIASVNPGLHGCGCERSGKGLCGKHGRY